MGKSKSKKKFRAVDVAKLTDPPNNAVSTNDTSTSKKPSQTFKEKTTDYKGAKENPHRQDERIALTEDSNLKTPNVSEVASSDVMGACPETVAHEISHSSETTSESTNEFFSGKIARDVTYRRNSSRDNNPKNKGGKYHKKHNDSHYASPPQHNVEEEKLNESFCVDTTVNADNVQFDNKSTHTNNWDVDIIQKITPDCSQLEEKVKRPLNSDAAEFTPKSYCVGINAQAKMQSDYQEIQETGSEITHSHQQKTVEDTRYDRRDGNDNYHKQKPRFNHQSQSRQFENSGRRGYSNDYSQENSRSSHYDKNRRSQQNKSFNERGRGRFSSNSRGDRSEGYGGGGKYYNQRERNPSFGKDPENSVSEENWDEECNPQPYSKGYEYPQDAPNLASSQYKHGEPENSASEKNWDAECDPQPYAIGYEDPQGARNVTSQNNDNTSYRQQDIESISKMNIRDVDYNSAMKLNKDIEVLPPSQKPRGLSDSRMERETEMKQQSNDIWLKKAGRKQRKPSSSPQDVDKSERTKKQNTSLQDDKHWDHKNDPTIKQNKSFRETQKPRGLSDPRMEREIEMKQQNNEKWVKKTGRKQRKPSPSPQNAGYSESTEQENTSIQDNKHWDHKNDPTIKQNKSFRETQKPRGLCDPRMEREIEMKQQNNESWLEKTSRKPSPKPQDVDNSEITKQHQDDKDWDNNDDSNSGYTEDYDGWNDITIKQRRSFPESKPKHETERKSLGGKIEISSKEDYDRSYEKIDVEYREFNEKFRWNAKVDYIKVTEKNQDLFELAKDYSYSLGHCVAEDFKMGSGIAVTFKRDFKGIHDLLSQRQKQGGMAVLENNNRYIYYLVTKRISTGKPTYETFWSSLKAMREHIVNNGVKKLAIPKIGCGLDRLEWTKVKYMIEFLFEDVDVEIVVCNFQQMEDTPQKHSLSTRLVYHHEPLKDIDKCTIILYFSTEEGHISKEMEELDNKFNFLVGFRRSSKKSGVPIRHEIENYILYGCIVRKKLNDLFDFQSFANCLSEINKNNRKDQYSYVALQPVHAENDDLLNEKVITLLRNYLKQVDIYICSVKTPEEQTFKES